MAENVTRKGGGEKPKRPGRSEQLKYGLATILDGINIWQGAEPPPPPAPTEIVAPARSEPEQEDDRRDRHDLPEEHDLPEKRYPRPVRIRGANGTWVELDWPDDQPGPEQELDARHRSTGQKKKR